MKLNITILVLSFVTVINGTKEHVPGHNPMDKPHEKDNEHNPHFDHEAVIGSRKDEEEFDDLTPEESKRRLGILVAKHDSNKDNVITKEELIGWLLQSFKHLDSEEARDKMEEEDADGDKKVSWRELVKQQYSYDLEDIEDFKKQPEKQEKEMKEFLEMLGDEEERFNTADLNHNGYLTESEYMAYYHPNEYPHMFESEIQRVLKRSDKNKDGHISKEEFLGDVSDKESRIAEEENFKLHDKNGNGVLSHAEIQSWVIQDNRQAADEEAVHLITMADDNKNGELSLAEITEHYDEFVGSQATDYGRHIEDEL